MEEERLKLVIPTNEYKEQVMNYRKVFLDNNESFAGCAGLEECNTYEEWIDFDNRLSKKYGESYVPSNVYLGIRASDNILVGIIDIRYKLSDFLYNYGGNIGYSVLPQERRKGYAKEMLKLALRRCKELKLDRILITCDKENIASSKTIIANGGVLENEVEDIPKLGKSEIIQRYWISLKKRFATDSNNMDIIEDGSLQIKSFENQDFVGDIALVSFKKMNKPYVVESINLCMANNNYKWLEFYDYSKKYRLTAMYNDKNEIIEWYFDIAREIGKNNGIPYEDDLYLDVIVTPSGDVILLDEDELKEAYNRREMTKEEYENAYKEAEQLMNKFKNNADKLKDYTDKYLEQMLGENK